MRTRRFKIRLQGFGESKKKPQRLSLISSKRIKVNNQRVLLNSVARGQAPTTKLKKLKKPQQGLKNASSVSAAAASRRKQQGAKVKR